MSETKLINLSESQDNLEVTRTTTYVTDLPSVNTLLNLKKLPKLPTEISLSGATEGGPTASVMLETDGTETLGTSPSQDIQTGFTDARDLPFDLPAGAPPLPKNATKKTQTQSHVKLTNSTAPPARTITAIRRMFKDSQTHGGTASFPRLQTRTSEELRVGPDTLSQVVGPLFLDGVNSALILRPHGSALGAFLAIDAAERQELWNGFRWGSQSAVDLWNTLQKQHQLELAPNDASKTPGDSHLMGMSKKVLRSALGAHSREWVTIIQMEGTDAGGGAIVLFSSQSLDRKVQALRTQLRPDTASGIQFAA